MSSLRALLLTDVVDSTKLTEKLGDAAMAELWVAHDRAARDLLPAWRGREIDKTDGMLLLFDSAADALGYVLAYHRALAALGLPFKARAGIHVGAVALRTNTPDDIARGAKPVEVDGLALPITARVMSVALGGQTLLSDDARLALGVTSHRVQSHGHWRLQGVVEPVELFEIGEAGAPFVAPPDVGKVHRVVRQGELWVPLHEVKHSLPAERDSFVGRQEPLLQLARKLDGGARLVSVLGMGGTGKTRLVTRFAWSRLGEFPGGVWFCDLSQARSVDGIYFAVAQGLDVPLGKTDPVVQLAHAIAGRGKCLVILDNFEQVARHAEETLGRWLDRAAQASFVVTTREVLGIAGEDTLALAPLPAPDAVTLFMRRAQAAKYGFDPAGAEQAAVVDLVKLLDNLPLAIELAAARVRVMPPRTLLARMSERFRLLATPGGRSDRQATLRNTLDWSWDLLSVEERSTLAQLSVFMGGFTRASVEAVVELPEGSREQWVVDLLHSLVEKSLVRQAADDRFDLLESVRDYAAEHLRTAERFAGSGEQALAAAQVRHWRYFAGLDERTATANGCVEASNLVVACRRAAGLADSSAAVDSMMRAWWVLRLSGPFRVGADLAALVRGVPGLNPSQLAEVDWAAGSALHLLGDVARASAHFEAGLALAVASGHRHCEARLLTAAADGRAAEGRHGEALDNLTRALAIARDLEDRSLQCLALSGLGRLSDFRGRLEDAREFYESALRLARELDDRRMEGGLLGNLGGLHHDHGRLDEARAHYEQALALARDVGDRRWEGNAHCNLGLVHHEQGHAGLARSQFDTALTMAREVGHVRLECTVHCNLGIALDAHGEFDAAHVHHEKAVRVAHELGDRRLEGQFRGYLGLSMARLGRMGDSRACLDAGEALLMAASDPLSLGLLLCSRAEAEHLAGDAAAAKGSCERALALATQSSVGADSELGRGLLRLQALLEPAEPARAG